jgi:hypothetical protein
MRWTAEFALGIAIAFGSCGSAASDEPPKKPAVANVRHPSTQVQHAAPASTLDQVRHAAAALLDQVRHAVAAPNQLQPAATTLNQVRHAAPAPNQVQHAATTLNQVRHAAPASNPVPPAATIPNQVQHATTISKLRHNGGAMQSRAEADNFRAPGKQSNGGSGETDAKSARFETPVVGSPEWNSRQTEEEGKEKELNRIIHSICHNC